ncbi:MAG: hypothetical protein JWM27_4814 [Gemmatimonadetes bacterium]|nr:hypothetical protein [Gemmatimonadota bacterium]
MKIHRLTAAAVLALAAACARGGDDGGAVKSRAPEPDTARGVYPGTASAAPWTALEPGGGGGVRLAADGTVSAGGRPFEPRLPLRDAAGSAVRYRISPPSPGARYAFVEGRVPDGASYLYVADLRGARLVPTHVLKYGPTDWVAYASTQPYGLLVSRQEGTAAFFAINLTDGTSKEVDFAALARKPKTAVVDEKTLRWKDGDTFTVSADVSCNAGLEDCRRDDGARAVAHAEVDLPSMAVRPLP